MDRIFLDANVLFSAAYRTTSRLGDLWELRDAELLSSDYAVEEARRNLLLNSPERLPELESLVSKLSSSGITVYGPDLEERLSLDAKDVPILLAAVTLKASHLLTGDKQHFGHLFEKRIGGVLILTPAMYWQQRNTDAAR